ncbi:acetyl-CoA synthetase-like protein [Violaceomyces palustris]|uniref:Acetyl-CoA synthetase-like protein n=1 Tax=Violaceomyces palustris TaxID=1673888 RepID=A0ACD0NLN8_9BASI|nr:acetyl-CoA synthetase-like protein [Violaceomyces palustris]
MITSGKTQYNPSTGIFKSDFALGKPALDRSLYDYMLGDIDFKNDRVVYKECWKAQREITMGELKVKAQMIGQGLREKGKLKPGDVVMLFMTNSLEFITILMATQFAGLKLALTNPNYGLSELTHAYKLTEPKLIFTQSTHFHKFVKSHIPAFKIVFADVNLNRGGVKFIGDLMVDEQRAIQAKPVEIKDLDQVAYLPFSSGTTGLPKAVEVTHRNVVAMLEIMLAIPDYLNGQPLRMIGILPFFHAYALLQCVHLPMKYDAKLFIMPRFEPNSFCDLIANEKITMAPIVPPVFNVLANHPKANRETFKTIEFLVCGAAPLDHETQKRLEDKIGVETRQGWGMTETTVGGLGFNPHMSKGSVGYLLPYTEAKILEPEKEGDGGERKALGFDVRGELLIRGPQVTKGYYKNVEASKASKTPDGFLLTGDVAVVSSKTGEFFIVDRVKELIKYKGWQVPPAELEGLLLTHPKIGAAAVVGVFSKKDNTELPRAFELKSKESVDEKALSKEIDEFVRKRVSPYKYLRGGVRLIDKVPLNPSGKILRKDIRKLVQAEQEEEEKLGLLGGLEAKL